MQAIKVKQAMPAILFSYFLFVPEQAVEWPGSFRSVL